MRASGHVPELDPMIHWSSARSSRRTRRRPASRWSAGSTAYMWSSSSGSICSPSGHGRGGGRRLDPERDVRLARAHERDPVLRLARAMSVRSTSGWAARKRAIAGGMMRRAGAREGDEPHAAGAQARDRVELGLGVGEPREDHVGVLDERATGVGEPHAARSALDERRARLPFERRDLLRDRGLGVRQRFGCGGERPLVRRPRAARACGERRASAELIPGVKKHHLH